MHSKSLVLNHGVVYCYEI